MKSLKKAMQALGARGKVSVVSRLGSCYSVTLNGEYFGLFDVERNLFVD